jgi:sucrose-6-phosphate hydrolase SacC (GH32 family)
MYGGPRFATIDATLTPKFGGVYHLWYHAATTPGSTSDIYHATSTDRINWTTNGPVLTHTGTGFELDQVAGPVIVVVSGTAYMYYDGDDNAGEAAKIGLATAPATP